MPLHTLLVKERSDYSSWRFKHTRSEELKCVCVCVAGYMCSPSVLDKDGVSAAAIAGEMISYLATKNTSLSQQLTAIFEE